jgi:hypothetical protein
MPQRKHTQTKKKNSGNGELSNDVGADLITQAQAARVRGVSRGAIHELVKRSRIESLRVNGRVMVYRSQVLAFEKTKTGPKPGGSTRAELLAEIEQLRAENFLLRTMLKKM